jgi:hypothetical protein
VRCICQTRMPKVLTHLLAHSCISHILILILMAGHDCNSLCNLLQYCNNNFMHYYCIVLIIVTTLTSLNTLIIRINSNLIQCITAVYAVFIM